MRIYWHVMRMCRAIWIRTAVRHSSRI
jgi:hypothetical protein